MPDRPLDAAVVAPLRDGAAMLQAVSARLAALTTGVDDRLGTAFGRLQAVPAAAQFDPFAVLAGVTAAVSATDARAGSELQRAASTAGADNIGQLWAAAARQAGAAAAPAAPPPGAAGRSSGNGPGSASAAGSPSTWLAHITERFALASRSAPAAGGSTKPPPGPPARTGGGLTGALVQASADLLGRQRQQPAGGSIGALWQDTALAAVLAAPGMAAGLSPGTTGARPASRPTTTLTAARIGEILRTIAAAQPQHPADVRAPTGVPSRADRRPAAASAPAVATMARPAAVPARRAPSLLLGGTGAVAGVASGLAQPATPNAPARDGTAPSVSAQAPVADADDVIAEINRLLVDQAWLRGVDLR